jgi:MFS superfamily sulfate permease-like transporter
MDLHTIRTALIISLSVLVIAILWRRLGRRVMRKDLPAVLHAELLALEVAYHPARLHIVANVPGEQSIRLSVLNELHVPVHAWEVMTLSAGRHELELQLPALGDGTFHLEMSTGTQRTERRFRLQHA